jgi:hypothetical protein
MRQKTIWMKTGKKRAKKSSRAKIIAPTLQTQWFDEPELWFAENNLNVDPKVGMNLFGPRSYGTDRHRAEVHFGFIGTGESIEAAAGFYEKCSKGVEGDTEHEPFPGCDKEVGLRLDLKIDTKAAEVITASELHQLRSTRLRRERFDDALTLLDDKLRILKLKDRPIDYVVFAVPEDLYDLCKTVDYTDAAIGQVHRDLRRAFKVLAMKHDKSTQIILNRTTTDEIVNRQVDHKSVRAWNLFTGLYFKVDGIPWASCGLDSETCYVGISFYRPRDSQSYLRASLAQAFDDQGEGFVLRGREFEWDEEKNGRSPHLTSEAARELIDNVVARYKQERKTLPKRIVIHKSSEYWPDEREGFMAGLKQVAQADMVALRSSSRVRLIREGLYPPLRGTAFHCGKVTHFYTTGYLKPLERYPHGHVPSPIEIYDHHGDSSKAKLIEEILILTKMNWNSADFCGAMPITLRFARLVGDILREIPEGFEPNPKYKFYM